MPRRPPCLLILLPLAMTATACTTNGSDLAVQSSPPPSSETATPHRSGSKGGATEELLLARQIQLVVGGDGIGPSCVDFTEPPAVFRETPSVWIRGLLSEDPVVVEYARETALCLRGFSTSQPIEVEISAGAYRSETQALPSGEKVPSLSQVSPTCHSCESPTALFGDGGVVRVYGEPNVDDGASTDVLVSEMWIFAPPEEAREALASADSFTVTARQGDLTASTSQRLTLPEPLPGWNDLEFLPVGDNRLTVYGFEAASTVPLGLYALDYLSDPPIATLLERVGEVTMPASQIAEFEVPENLLTSQGPGSYCVMPPVGGEVDCWAPVWPAYPGVASPGDTGARVAAWQKILITFDWVSDIPANRDGVYGPATLAAVEEELAVRGWTDLAPGGVLDRLLYAALTGSDPESG